MKDKAGAHVFAHRAALLAMPTIFQPWDNFQAALG